MTIMITTPSPLLADEFRRRDPDAFEILARLDCEFGDHPFNLRSEFLRYLDWPELRVLGAMTRLFAHEILIEIPESVH
ncbi:hypothetical protein [Bradyrhizobium erythrophlei]|uniref:Uncharacterized protein n=1 Tax=Bradyrhizobium erythrophlei TaxID=1437360 RepID=A0A1M7TED8_9BRAD|nr:hypothetical protein [Bradyrhizobium erythrophlei]SHN69109.1 hypothetical protein SAMN05444170_1496 [Bradyrhizobium erythrophlei]